MEQESNPRRALAGAMDFDRLQWGTLRDWGQLVRLPNVFTLFGDCVAAAIVAQGMLGPLTAVVPVILASLGAYWAGMILNDVVDLEEDREYRPTRPLAAGRISPALAGHVATGMLLLSPLLILGVATLHRAQPLGMGAAFLVAVLLSLAVRSYNSPLKRTLLGPPVMGLCRALNILMVGFVLLAIQRAPSPPSGGELETIQPLLALAAGIGLYIFGVTVYARREEQESSPSSLGFGIFLEIVGLVIIGFLPYWAEAGRSWTLSPQQGYPLLLALIGLTVVNRGVAGVMHPVPRKVQLAVKHAILTLILIDAAVVLMWAGPWYGCAVVALLLPALSSALRFRST
ncbi:MAG: UbiA family prenyltransferase [Planctomycetales bacterium]|nr:UbiA family prenyltransferase [Planctomycetales bacterium]